MTALRPVYRVGSRLAAPAPHVLRSDSSCSREALPSRLQQTSMVDCPAMTICAMQFESFDILSSGVFI
jgi:hypothetical protein